MSSLIVSLNENTLKLSLSTQSDFKSVSTQIDSAVAKDTQILNANTFSEILFNLIKEISKGSKVKNSDINFLLEPQDAILRFITLSKKVDSEEQVIQAIREKVTDISLDDLYFSYQKIAPFVYQFVGVKRDQVHTLMDVANNLGFPLRSVVPWLLLLPKFVGRNEPAIFVSKSDNDQIVALSELNGIYFSQVFEKEKSSKELEKLVGDLSVYKRTTPITKIYTIKGDSFSLDPHYDVAPLIPADQVSEDIKGFEIHALYNRMVNEDLNILTSQLNALNMVPVPAVKTKNNALVYAGATLAAVLVIGGGFFFMIRNKNSQEVLSETNESTQSTQSTVPTVPAVALNKADIKIRVENAAGIPGLAAKAQTYLQGKGYTVPSIDTADESGRTTTLIRYKESKKAYIETLTSDMKPTYEVSGESGLDEALDYDILVLLGQK